MDTKFKELLVFAESDTMRDYIVDISSHVGEIISNITMQFGLTEEEIDEICAANIPDETPSEIYSPDFEHKFGYLFWRLFHFRNWDNLNLIVDKEEDDEFEDLAIDSSEFEEDSLEFEELSVFDESNYTMRDYIIDLHTWYDAKY